MNTGAIILAAGESRRLGKPKQLFQFHGISLLRRTAEVALESVCDPVVVVLGYEADHMRRELNGLQVLVAENERWADGIGSSIVAGTAALSDIGSVDAVIILLCDQIKLTPLVIDALVDTQRMTGASIVASEYGGTLGVPALFTREIFPELLALESDSGAKRVIEKHRDSVAQIEFPDGVFDIDTPEDSLRLESK